MTPQEFIAKYEGWFSYTRREELKKEMESDLDAVFQALHQPPVMVRSEQLRAFKQFLQSEYHLPVSNRMVDEFEQKQSS